jgi:predicted nucleic acid-binding Zn ribbon protein
MDSITAVFAAMRNREIPVRVCEVCFKEFEGHRRHRRTCSHECREALKVVSKFVDPANEK